MRKWVEIVAGMIATTMVLSGATDAANPSVQSPATYIKRAESPGPAPTAWLIDHDSLTNNPVFGTPSTHDGPNYLVMLPALANSAPVYVNHFVYVVGGYVDGPRNAPHPGFVWALNPATGAIEWTIQTPNSVFAQPIVAGNLLLIGVGNAAFAHPTQSPATTPGMVRGVGPSGLYAFDATNGRVVWMFGTAGADQAPPTVVGNTVYLASGDRHLYALRLRTGKELWATNIGHYVSRSSPRIIGHYAYLGGAGPLGVVAVNLRTHRVAWQRLIPGALEGVDDTPLATTPNRLITAALTGPKGILPDSKRHAARLFALNPRNGNIVWAKTLAIGRAPMFKSTGTPTVMGGTVYAGNAINGRIAALSVRTGKILWSVAVGSPVTRPPAVIGRDIEVLTKSGDLVALSRRGKILARRPLANWVNAYGPVIYNDSVAVAGNTSFNGYAGMIPLLTGSTR